MPCNFARLAPVGVPPFRYQELECEGKSTVYFAAARRTDPRAYDVRDDRMGAAVHAVLFNGQMTFHERVAQRGGVKSRDAVQM